MEREHRGVSVLNESNQPVTQTAIQQSRASLLIAYLDGRNAVLPEQSILLLRNRLPREDGRGHSKEIREFQNLNCPNPLGLDCQIQAHCPEIRRIWQSGESIVG